MCVPAVLAAWMLELADSWHDLSDDDKAALETRARVWIVAWLHGISACVNRPAP